MLLLLLHESNAVVEYQEARLVCTKTAPTTTIK